MIPNDKAPSNAKGKESTGKKVQRVIFPAGATPAEIADVLNDLLNEVTKTSTLPRKEKKAKKKGQH